jgi:hypothetical protein
MSLLFLYNHSTRSLNTTTQTYLYERTEETRSNCPIWHLVIQTIRADAFAPAGALSTARPTTPISYG